MRLMGKIFNNQSQTITSAALILAAASLASRFLGLLRDRLLAGHFGAGDILDSYYAAFRIPDTVYNLLVLGALSAGFIPVFVGLLKKERSARVWEFVNNVLNILILGFAAAGVIFFIFTPQLVKLITPGFSSEKISLTVSLTRIMFLSPVLLGISSIWGGVLQSLKKFFIFSLTPIFYNLGIIFGVLFLVPTFGTMGLAWGVVLGALLHMGIQLPAIIASGWRWQPFINWKDEAARRMARLTVPRVLTLAVSQLNFLAITILASSLASGSLAIYDLSYNIWSFPLGILAGSLAIAAFPTFSAQIKTGDKLAFAKTFSGTFRQILFLIIPASALFLVLRAQLVRVILGTGRFNWDNTILTIDTLKFFTLGLFADALILLLIRGFFAFEDTKTPFFLGILSSVFRIFGAWFFSRSMGVAGLALGYALGSIVNFILLWVFLERRAGGLNSREIIWSAGKIVLAAFFAGLSAYATLYLMDIFVDTHRTFGIFLQGLAAGLVGITFYFLGGLVFKSTEMQVFYYSLKNRLPFRSVAPDKEIIQQ